MDVPPFCLSAALNRITNLIQATSEDNNASENKIMPAVFACISRQLLLLSGRDVSVSFQTKCFALCL